LIPDAEIQAAVAGGDARPSGAGRGVTKKTQQEEKGADRKVCLRSALV